MNPSFLTSVKNDFPASREDFRSSVSRAREAAAIWQELGYRMEDGSLCIASCGILYVTWNTVYIYIVVQFHGIPRIYLHMYIYIYILYANGIQAIGACNTMQHRIKDISQRHLAQAV